MCVCVCVCVCDFESIFFYFIVEPFYLIFFLSVAHFVIVFPWQYALFQPRFAYEPLPSCIIIFLFLTSFSFHFLCSLFVFFSFLFIFLCCLFACFQVFKVA